MAEWRSWRNERNAVLIKSAIKLKIIAKARQKTIHIEDICRHSKLMKCSQTQNVATEAVATLPAAAGLRLPHCCHTRSTHRVQLTRAAGDRRMSRARNSSVLPKPAQRRKVDAAEATLAGQSYERNSIVKMPEK